MAANFPKWFPSGFRLINGLSLSNWFNNPSFSYEDAITARAGGGQANAYQLSAIISRVSVCASANDSVKLPSSSKIGGIYWIVNDGAQSLQVFGRTVATIDGVATATGVAIGAGKRAAFMCMATSPIGQWYSMGGSKTT